jgi:Raf kinase inhibitor-like YbhB/YbcL family protein
LGRYGRAVGWRAGAAGRRARAAAIAGALCLLSGCGLVGGPVTLRQDAPDIITVTSPMVEQGSISSQYTCHGAGQSPPILWSVMPPGTKSIALVVDDAAAPITPRVYWIVFNISPDAIDLQAGALPTGARQARNSLSRANYNPPCPVGARHRYRFTIYALSTMLHQPNDAPLRAAWSAIARNAIARGRLTAAAAP